MARFVSVDPLAEKFQYLTTYQYAGNTPIWATDLDGAEPDYTNDEDPEKKKEEARNAPVIVTPPPGIKPTSPKSPSVLSRVLNPLIMIATLPFLVTSDTRLEDGDQTEIDSNSDSSEESVEDDPDEDFIRVRHQTSPEAASAIMVEGQIKPSRKAQDLIEGVDVELPPFQDPETASTETGAAAKGAFVEFNAKKGEVTPTPNVSTNKKRRTGRIVTGGAPLKIRNRQPVSKPSKPWWKIF